MNRWSADEREGFSDTLLSARVLDINVSDPATAMNLFLTFNGSQLKLEDVDFFKDELFQNFPGSDVEKSAGFHSIWKKLEEKSQLAFWHSIKKLP